MRKRIFLYCLLIGVLTLILPQKLFSQAPVVQTALRFDVSIPLRDMKPARKHFWDNWRRENDEREVPNKFKHIPANYANTPDGAWQSAYNNSPSMAPTVTNPIQNFPGISNNANSGRVTPPDPNGDVGPNHYVQVVNCMFQVFSKTGTSLYGPVTTSTLWNGFSGPWTGHNDGDAVVLYDEQADRWLVAQFAIDCGSTPYGEYELVAISTTGDPTGSWYRYAFSFDYMPDYPKIGVWQDGYYMAVNRFNTNTSGSFVGAGGCVMNRTKMLAGDGTATMIYFKTETLGGSGSGAGADCYSMLPSDCDGVWAPTNAPNYFTYINDNTGAGASELRIWSLHADFTTPANSTFTYVTNLPVTTYTMLGTFTGVVPQQGTTNKLDGLGDRLMFRNQYRNFSSYETFLTCHSVSINSVSGVRWYEYRKTGSVWSVYQQSTYAPSDGKWRWLGSLAMNVNGDIGLAYTVSSGTMYPSIYFTGRKAADALNTMTQTEGIIQTGTVAMTGATRWGDYASTNIDPSDNITFWTTNEYIGTYGGTWPWSTKIASFKWSNQPSVATQAATAITMTTATLNGTVNPNGLATTYHFEWGTSVSYGNNTATLSAGSGTSNVPETAAISGLTTGTTYHFRIDATNSDGTSNGIDFSFIPGAAAITTTAATAITQTTATAGGNVTTDGGSSVTARGTCWSTTANPTVSGSHTTDGTGTGTFTSSLTGLTANTTYHHRAYATNGAGTYYGADLTFTTLCSVSALPFTEGFAGTTIPGCWTQVDHQGNGQIWLFGVITGQSPNPNLNGNYAYLNSDAYGSGNSQNADLVSPTIDCSSASSVTLQFNHYFKAYSGSSGTVSYSINNGSTWTTIQTFTTTTTSNPTAFNQTIAALGGQSQVKIRWNYTGTYGYYWGVDDVQLTGTTAPTLNVLPSNQNVPNTAGSTTFNVTSNSSWTVTSNQTWCTVTPSGTGNGTITANYAQNTTINSRVANITVTVATLTPVIVTVTQAAGLPTLSVLPPNQNVPNTIGSTAFTVTSNTNWTVVSDQTWCTVTPSGTGNGTITANYTDNPNITTRIANVTVTVTGLTPVIVTVTQAAGAPTLGVTPSNQNVPAPTGSTTFNVTSNTNWTAVSNQSWCTVTPSGTGNGTITANYTDNTTVNTRVANITVTVATLTPLVVTVTQSGTAPTLNIVPSNQDVPAPAGQTNFTVTSNSSWTVVSDQSWCVPTSAGSGNGTIYANYADNTTVNPRIANLTVTVAGLSPSIVTVTQSGEAPTLNVTPPNQNVTYTSGSTNFSVTSNSNWTVVSDQTWCIPTPTGTGNGTLTANYSQNLSTSPRVAALTVNVSGVAPNTVTVTQDGFVGISEITNDDISLIPNPNTGLFLLKTKKGADQILNITIYDNSGNTILSKECRGSDTYEFDLRSIAKGEYYMKIKSVSNTLIRKVIIQ
ncbi:MAG: BACON domain-containing carbohydrate-binding protein [Bacteroidetes bacterium]|nr:BACON domain-containing carbohydrate-binding protein [Bacteroidota bacterium]